MPGSRLLPACPPTYLGLVNGPAVSIPLDRRSIVTITDP